MKPAMKTVFIAMRVGGLACLMSGAPTLAQDLRQPLERGSRVTIECLTGDVVVTGSDEQALTVVTDGNPSEIKLKRLEDGTYRVFIEPPLAPRKLQASVPREGVMVSVRTRSASARVRDVEAAAVTTVSGGVSVERVSGDVVVSTTSGRIRVSEVGAARLRTVSGDVEAQLTRGRLTVSAVSGNFVAADIDGDITAQTVSGNANIHCARGRVDVATVSGDVKLTRLENEILVETTSGNVTFVGALTPVKRCAINAFSGDIRLAVPETCGFEGKFKSFRGVIQSDFPLNGAPGADPTNPAPLNPGAPTGPPPRPGQPSGASITWRHGDGAAKVFLTTFSGKATLIRNQAIDTSPCAPPGQAPSAP